MKRFPFATIANLIRYSDQVRVDLKEVSHNVFPGDQRIDINFEHEYIDDNIVTLLEINNKTVSIDMDSFHLRDTKGDLYCFALYRRIDIGAELEDESESDEVW